MAEVAYDPNKQDDQHSITNILSPQPVSPRKDENSNAEISSSGANYVSTGNPYGQYGQPQSAGQNQQSFSQSSPSPRKSTSNTPSSGMHTNVQSYMDKNKAGSQQLGQAVSGKLQSSADLARQNLAGTEKSFQQGMDAGSLENWQGAVDEARGAYQQAAGQKAPERQFQDNLAYMYRPEQMKQSSGNTYSAEDQALIDSNMARVVFGDGSTRDFKTQAEAQTAINDWNRQNPGYYTYGDQEQLSVSDDRLRDILNARYAGPTDLHQVSGYSDVYNQFNKAQNLQDLAQSTGFKGTLLKETFENPNMTYSLGNQLLDDLLLGRGEAADTLRETAQNLGATSTGRIGDEFSQRVADARNLALGRASDIDNVRTGARTALDEVALGREAEIESRLSEVIDNWEKYPQHYRDALTQELQRHETLKQNYSKYGDLPQRVKDIPNIQKEILDIQSSIPDLEKAVLDARKLTSSAGDTRGYQRNISTLAKALNKLANAKNRIQSLNSQIAETRRLEQELGTKGLSVEDFTNFNPNSMNLGLSQLEAQMLGIQGGEGLYNILKNGGVDNLIKTAAHNRERLISQDEQSQLNRLQSIAELAEDYGSVDSGIDFRNQYINRDLAGTQSALDALDMDHLRNILQSSEKEFRDYAEGANIRGTGHGKGSSGGAFGSTSKRATINLDTNLGDLIDKSKGWRNIYSDEGANQENVNRILGLSDQLSQLSGELGQGKYSGIPNVAQYLAGNVDPSFALTDPLTQIGLQGQGLQNIGSMYKDLVGDTVVGDILGITAPGVIANNLGSIGSGISKLANSVSSAAFGNAGEAKKKAIKKATAAAKKDLENKVNKAIQNSGYLNQLGVIQDTQRDLELLELLGLLDKTNR